MPAIGVVAQRIDGIDAAFWWPLLALTVVFGLILARFIWTTFLKNGQ